MLLCGCGYVGDPMPPALNVPERIADLRAVQRGDRILIEFTIPQFTTDGLPIRKLGGVDLRIGAAAEPFSFERWMTGSDTVPVQETTGSVEAIAPASDWYGRLVTVGVRLMNSNRRPSEWSNLVVLAVTQPLAAPTEVRASPHAKGIAITWKAPPRDQLQFRIFRRVGDEKESAVIGTTDTLEYIDSAVGSGKRYEYSVQAVSGSSESEATPPVAIVARDVTGPSAPNGLTAVASLNSIELGWERSGAVDLSHYRVYRAEADGSFVLLADNVPNPAFSDRQVTSGKTYRYLVTGVDQSGNEGERTPPVQVVAP
jgi:hypothetical protein